ncbi:MAG: mannose-1-phosphate guanylyltransferase/mannose-6-phosphate isomerase [Desulfobacterales bacterium]
MMEPRSPRTRTPVYAILLAGGTGTRMWPVSRTLYPKQLVKFVGRDSLVQHTIKRLLPILAADCVRVVCGAAHEHEIARHLDAIGIQSSGKIICEPCGRNTAPAILLALLSMAELDPEFVVCVFPADHVIDDLERFHADVNAAIELARMGYIVTFGIQPHFPETGYGYIEGGDPLPLGASTIRRFVEKPDLKTAQQYLAAGNFYWNSGMFCFQAAVMAAEFEQHQTALYRALKELLARDSALDAAGYQQLPDISIDYAIMEKTSRGAVLPSRFRWSDIGSWKSLYDFLPKDGDHNVIDGDVLTQNTRNCFIMGHQRLIAANNVQDLVIIETPDAVFVSDIDNSREVKHIVSRLKAAGRREHHHHATVYHAWGRLTLLEDNPHLKVVRRVVYPGKCCDLPGEVGLQRSLTGIQGSARLSAEDQNQLLRPGSTVSLAAGVPAEIASLGDERFTCVETLFGE